MRSGSGRRTARSRFPARACRPPPSSTLSCRIGTSISCWPIFIAGFRRGHRLLVDHGDLVAADGAQLLVGHLAHVLALEAGCGRRRSSRHWTRSRMMPSDTVDLPQPDSPTMPMRLAGHDGAGKSITAGISPPLGEEGDRQVLDARGWGSAFSDVRGFDAASFIDLYRAAGFGASGSTRSILQRLFAQRVGQQVEAQHEASSARTVGGSAGMDEGAQQAGWHP